MFGTRKDHSLHNGQSTITRCSPHREEEITADDKYEVEKTVRVRTINSSVNLNPGSKSAN